MDCFFKCMLRYSNGGDNRKQGVLGTTNAYYGCIEAQGRGSLHCHMLVWIDGSLNPDELRHRLLNDPDFERNFVTFLEDNISSDVPHDPLPDARTLYSTQHLSKLRGPPISDSEYNASLRQHDLHFLAESSQRHSHSATCYKHWKGVGHQKDCRFNLDASNVTQETTVHSETGEIELRKLDGLVNNYNSTILQALRCNMDIKFIGSGTSSKAVLYYITDYITKTPLKAHVAFAALDVAMQRLGAFNPEERDLQSYASSMLHKCAFSMISRQELSGQEISSHLRGNTGSKSSHNFKSFIVEDALDAMKLM
ncbi:hypothetical protein BJ165DRAFT_1416403 [Panaeolus papilionaceus]|nr:hypothetical protein BJ165DRAFT_1416403 [Panaeolus papilionaceus]